jgi:hypothetical protein
MIFTIFFYSLFIISDNLMGQTSWQFLLIVGLSVLTSNLVLNQVNAVSKVFFENFNVFPFLSFFCYNFYFSLSLPYFFSP